MPRSAPSEQILMHAAPPAPRVGPISGRTELGWPVQYGLSLAWVAAVTILGVVVEHLIQAPSLALAFVLPVVLAAVTFGWGPSLFAAIAGVLACDFFFIEPRYTLWVADPVDVWSLGLLLVVGVIVSTLAAQSRDRAVAAERAADQARALQALAHVMVETRDPAKVTTAAVEALGRIFEAPAVVLTDKDGALAIAAGTRGARLSAADMDAAAFAFSSRLATRAEVYPIEKATFDFWPVATPAGAWGVLGVRLAGRDSGRPVEAASYAEIIAAYLASALDGGKSAV